MTQPVPAPHATERVAVLDVLRGIALLGMFLVHFSMYSSGGSAVDRLYQGAVALLFEERFWAIFAILFGAGFAIQLRRAQARGGRFVAPYLRRLAALAVFGFVAHAVFGVNVLLSYAMWGVALVFMRRWSVRALVVALVLSAVSWNVYLLGGAAYGIATQGEQRWGEQREAAADRASAFRDANRKAQESSDYATVFAARLQHVRWFYAQPFSFLPMNTLTLLLLGVLAVRLGLFDAPERHRRLILALMAFGVAAWAFETWRPFAPPAGAGDSVLRTLTVARAKMGFGLVRSMWLAFTYMGAVLLLVARYPAWLRRLSALGFTGRVALTNYMVQIAVLELIFAKYAFGITVTPLAGVAMALALFFADAWMSRWWLARFRYGPLEWLWRSVTYARWQPWRNPAPARAPLVLEPSGG
jgi:uncharacterized protein